MNERIRELAEQAGYQADMFGIGHWDQPECQKFAELIIQECVKSVTCNEALNILDRFGIDSEHFGVEE